MEDTLETRLGNQNHIILPKKKKKSPFSILLFSLLKKKSGLSWFPEWRLGTHCVDINPGCWLCFEDPRDGTKTGIRCCLRKPTFNIWIVSIVFHSKILLRPSKFCQVLALFTGNFHRLECGHPSWPFQAFLIASGPVFFCPRQRTKGFRFPFLKVNSIIRGPGMKGRERGVHLFLLRLLLCRNWPEIGSRFVMEKIGKGRVKTNNWCCRSLLVILM